MPDNLDFKVAVFDLDLTLWDGKQLFPETVAILSKLRQEGVLMYVASFHQEAESCCKELGIIKFFERIFYGRHMSKSDMISIIMTIHNGLPVNELVFFDDNIDNIVEVGLTNRVRTIHVNKQRGISWDVVPKPVFEKYFTQGTFGKSIHGNTYGTYDTKHGNTYDTKHADITTSIKEDIAAMTKTMSDNIKAAEKEMSGITLEQKNTTLEIPKSTFDMDIDEWVYQKA
jgi:predicted phosphatase